MAISVEASNTQAYATATDPQTVGVTVPGSLSNSIMIACSGNPNFQPSSWASDVDSSPDATFGTHDANGDYLQWARWMAPTAGAHTITADYAGNIRGGLTVVVLSGVDQTTPIANAATDSGASVDDDTLTVTSSTGGLVMGACAVSDGCTQDITAAGGETNVGTVPYNSGQYCVLYEASGASSTVLSWDWTTCTLNSVLSGFEIKAAAGGASSTVGALAGEGGIAGRGGIAGEKGGIAGFIRVGDLWQRIKKIIKPRLIVPGCVTLERA